MKFLTRIILLYMLVFALTGCIAKGIDPTEDSYNNLAQSDNNDVKEEEIVEEIIPPIKLLVWSYTDEILKEIKGFEDKYNAEITVELQDINGFVPMVAGVLKGQQNMPDIILMDDVSIKDKRLEGLLLDMNDVAMEANAYEIMVPYAYNNGISIDGSITSFSYHVTPIAMFYRRSLAIKAFGTDEPKQVLEYFSSYDKISEAADLLQTKDIKIFSDIYTMRYFSGLQAQWLDENNELVVDDEVRKYFELIRKLRFDENIAHATEWSSDWLEGMYKPINNEHGEDMEIFAYILPNWALSNILMLTGESEEAITSNEDGSIKVFNDTAGDWGIIDINCSTNMGGTYIAVNDATSEVELAKEFVKYMVFDKEHLDDWLGNSDMISSLKTVQANQDFSYGNDFIGGQNYHEVFSEIANNIEVPKEEKEILINNIHSEFDRVVMKFFNLEYHTIDEALKEFKNNGMLLIGEEETEETEEE